MSNQKIPDKAGVIIFPPLLYLITLALGITVSYFFPYKLLQSYLAVPIGMVVLIVGIVFLILSARTLIKNKTTVNPDGASTTIVKEGIFLFTRNPMYFSLTLIYIGTSIMLNAWASFFLIIPLLIIVQKGIIEREEKYLTRKFGDEYLSYKSKVSRWL